MLSEPFFLKVYGDPLMIPLYQALNRPSLSAFLGANGVKTSEIRSIEEFMEIVKTLYEFDASAMTGAEIESTIDGLGKSERRLLVKRNLGKLPARLVSTKPAHQRAREGRLTKRDRKYLATRA
jgi:hypothetical protein